ncbi:MAG: ABC transporter permease [Firmicutes bacterium]|nr:ABC transporter permease [Bacillota bacterium]
MLRYFLKRLIGIVITIVLVGVVIFILVRLMPGDPVRQMVDEEASLEAIEALREEYGLNKPIIVQFVDWFKGMLTGNLGKSYRTGEPIINEVSKRYGKTILLAVLAVIWSTVVGLILGVWTGTHEGKWQDYLGVTLAVAGQAVPTFWIGLMLILVLSVHFHLLPVSGVGTWKHLVMPAFTLGLSMAAAVTRFTRSAVLECLKEDYVRTARSKGVKERVVIWRHVLRNSLISVITIVGLQFGAMLGGAVMIETVFAYPGIGSYLVTSITYRDYPIVQALVMILALNFVVVNFVVDLLYALANPEIRLEGGGR